MGIPSVGDKVQFVGEVERVFGVTGAVYVKTLDGSVELTNADRELRTVPESEWARLLDKKSDEQLKRSARLFGPFELVIMKNFNASDIEKFTHIEKFTQNKPGGVSIHVPILHACVHTY